MDQQKIDRLFREKLDSYEVTPSDQSWLEVEKKIGAAKSSTKFYWIAAAVSVIIVSWVVWPQNKVENLTPIASEVNHPVLETQIEFEWAIPAVENVIVKDEPKVIKQSTVQLVAQEPIKDQVDQVLEEVIKDVPEVELNTRTAVAEVEIEEENPQLEIENTIEKPTESKIKVDLSKVKITYIAANAAEKKQEKDSVGAFKKLIAFAGKISPGEVLADLKTKKDDFINGGFKSKEKDRTSL